MDFIAKINNDGTYPNISNNNKMLNLIDMFVPLFGHKHRFSIQGGALNTDRDLVNALIKHYPQFDGYICQNMWPSYHHGGFLSPETCLFKPKDCIAAYKQHVGGERKRKKRTHTGGFTGNVQHFDLDAYLKENDMNIDNIIVGGERFVDQWPALGL